METSDRPNALTSPPPEEDPEEQGLRILARIVARRLARSGRCERALASCHDENSVPIMSGGTASESVEEEGLTDSSSSAEVREGG